MPSSSRNSSGIIACPRADTETTFTNSVSLILFFVSVIQETNIKLDGQ